MLPGMTVTCNGCDVIDLYDVKYVGLFLSFFSPSDTFSVAHYRNAIECVSVGVCVYV